jgi:hypothetical protein
MACPNRIVMPLLDGVAPSLLTPPLNVMRLSFHPEGLAPRTVHLAEWCTRLLERLHRHCEATADPVLMALYNELETYPIPARDGSALRWPRAWRCRIGFALVTMC